MYFSETLKVGRVGAIRCKLIAKTLAFCKSYNVNSGEKMHLALAYFQAGGYNLNSIHGGDTPQ